MLHFQPVRGSLCFLPASFFTVLAHLAIAVGVAAQATTASQAKTGLNASDADIDALRNEARALQDKGEFPLAIAKLDKALDLVEKRVGPSRAQTAALLNDLANHYYALGQHAKAELLYERSLEIREAQPRANPSANPNRRVPDGAAPSSDPADRPGVWRATLTGHAGEVRCVAIAKEAALIASGGVDKTVHLWDATTGKERSVLSHASVVHCLDLSADGKKLASGDAEGVLLWNVATGEKLATLKGKAGPINQVAFAANGNTVAAAGWGWARIWYTRTGKPKTNIDMNGLSRIALAPDGKTLAASDANGTVQLWDTFTRKSRVTLAGHKGPLGSFALTFSPDGRTLATGAFAGGMKGDGQDTTIKIWDVATGQERAALVGHKKGIYLLAFSPDGTTILATDYTGRMNLWDPSTARVKATLGRVRIGHRLQGTPVGCWAIAPDLKSWAVGAHGAGHEVRWYDIADFTKATK